MEEFFYTSCPRGMGLEETPGFQVRAASPGLMADRSRLAELVRNVGYSLPSGMPAHSTSPDDAPVRYVFVGAGSQDAVLLQSRYAGRDHDNRPGNFFAHAVTDLPQSFDALDAIRLWRSRFWKPSDPGQPKDLPPVDPASLTPGSLGDSDLAALLSTEEGQDQISFLMQGFLSLKEGCRVYIGAEPERVAVFVYGMARLLPRGPLRGRLTFSTFETSPDTSPARVVGSWWEDDSDFPPNLYQGYDVVLNTKDGRRSTIEEVAPHRKYVEYMIRLVTQTGPSFPDQLDPFLKLCDESGVEDPEELDRCRRVCFSRAKPPDDEDVAAVLENERAARAFLKHPPFRQAVIRKAMEKGGFESPALPALKRLPEHLRDLPDERQAVCDVLASGIQEAIDVDDPERAVPLLEGMLDELDPERANAIRQRLFDDLNPPAKEGEETGLDRPAQFPQLRVFLIRNWAKAGLWPPAKERFRTWDRWLCLADGDLTRVLEDEDLPVNLKCRAMAVSMAARPAADHLPGARKVLMSAPPLVAGTFCVLIPGKTAPLAMELYKLAVAAHGLPGAKLLSDSHRSVAGHDQDRVAKLFELLFQQLPADAVPGIYVDPPEEIAHLCAHSDALRARAWQSAGELDARCLDDPSLERFLEKLTMSPGGAQHEGIRSVESWIKVFDFFQQVTPFQDRHMARLSGALADLGAPDICKDGTIQRKLLVAVKGQADMDMVFEKLTDVLVPAAQSADPYGITGADGRKRELLVRLSLALRDMDDKSQTWPARRALVAVGLGGAKSRPLREVFKTPLPQTATAISALIKSGGNAFVGEIDKAARSYPRTAKWNYTCLAGDVDQMRRPGLIETAKAYVERFWLPIVGALALVAAGMLYVAYKQGVFDSPPPGKKPKKPSSVPIEIGPGKDKASGGTQ